MRKITLILFILPLITQSMFSQQATIHEEMMEMKTYGFSDPDPVANIGRLYPYYRYDGFTNNPEMNEWKMVILENDYIKVFVCPDIGGKVWGAVEKSTGGEFLYFNHVVKFRDIAMRGPWTSGGLEFNFGDIGHIPTCATPVDYVMKENNDGSVSCVVGAIDLPSGTKWNVEVVVHPDKAYFETITKWFNNTSVPTTYYHWMNAAAKSAGNLEFIYPGSNWIGHGDELGDWPVDNGRDVNYYENNNFGSYKSYHVLNSYSDFFGGYYHDDNFGFGHLSAYDEKPGKKLWIWGLSDQGMIWEDLLTDDDGQYIEFQAGKLFNQAADKSTDTPFKHKEFQPNDTDVMHEIWFPLKETGGMVGVSPEGILNIEDGDNAKKILFGALQTVNDKLLVLEDKKVVKTINLELKPLENVEFDYVPKAENFEVHMGSGELLYSSKPEDNALERPLKALKDFNWESAYGLYTKGLEFEKQRNYIEAKKFYLSVIEKDPGFLPALNRIALAYYREMDYTEALKYIMKSLMIDTYDPEANYLYGLLNVKFDRADESKSGFSIASSSLGNRSSAYLELAKLFFREGDFDKSLDYARKSLSFNIYNISTYQVLALALRKMGLNDQSELYRKRIFELDATNHFPRFEEFILSNDPESEIDFKGHITNELPYESYIDLAMFYFNMNCFEEASKVLMLCPDYPVKHIWLYHLDKKNAEDHMFDLKEASPSLAFPYRSETATILEGLIKQDDNWKFKYYLALIYWNKGLDQKAQELFNECGDEPDFPFFYLSKSELFDDDDIKSSSLLKAVELDPEDWRAGMALVEMYLSGENAKEALPICEKFLSKYPEQSAIGLSYAKVLMQLEEYQEAVEFLEGYNVLPFEGATAGRDLYHEACIKLAQGYLDHKDYKKVILYANKALKWPFNLGVGRPYDVDESIERSLIEEAEKGLR